MNYGSPPAGPPPGSHGPPPSAPSDDTTTIILLGVGALLVMFLGCFMCGPLCVTSLALSIPAVVMARSRLELVEQGVLPEHQRSTLQLGLGLGAATTALSVLAGLAYLVVLVLYGGMIGALMLGGASGHL